MNRDVLVVGAGVFGAATAWALAERGAHVLAVDAHGPTHRYGSSHGEGRIFRRAYWEGPSYLPLLDRAYELWTELEETDGEPLLVRTGGVFVGSSDSGVVDRSRRTALLGGIEHAVWDAERLAERFPWFGVDPDMEALYEPGACTVLATRARLAMLDAAVRRRAGVRFGDEVVAVRSAAQGLDVRLRSGETVSCGSVVLATGPWAGQPLDAGAMDPAVLGAEFGAVLRPVRVPVYWFRADPRLGTAGFPAFLHESADGRVVYGLAEQSATRGVDGPLVKIGFHNHQQRPGDPRDTAPHDVPPAFRREMSEAVARVFTGIDPEPVSWRNCYYTLTPDGGFVIDRAARDPRIVHVAACSGHGFKFATAAGECAAALALGETPGIDLEPYGAQRFGGSRTGSDLHPA
ncbi:N-methyl-L-tryptophan oxidase [Streptomyces sp. CRN 30]|uniref:N-methyl-L-tryptophan oxidase n=1 Tax=Streptomyces sp. CRN 30 TaxID=3075613 RepID=UPI002A7F59FC|nr:N-methyl-L-tryptophan oxidase [Streptomyces sp. CRN 30]